MLILFQFDFLSTVVGFQLAFIMFCIGFYLDFKYQLTPYDRWRLATNLTWGSDKGPTSNEDSTNVRLLLCLFVCWLLCLIFFLFCVWMFLVPPTAHTVQSPPTKDNLERPSTLLRSKHFRQDLFSEKRQLPVIVASVFLLRRSSWRRLDRQCGASKLQLSSF